MTTFWTRTLAAATLAGAAFMTPGAQAATQSYVFSGALDSGAYLGETFSGSFSFDDLTLSGVGLELLNLDTLHIQFHGQTYGLAQAAVAPDVAFQDGSFLGLEYSHDASLPSFTTVAGTVDASDAYLAYDTAALGQSGAGSISYQMALVPDASALWLSLSGLAMLGWARRQRYVV